MWILLLLALAATAVSAHAELLNYRLWLDEFESLVTGRMMASGLRLYEQIFTQEGPLHLVVASLIARTGAGLAGYRLVVDALQWCMIVAILFGSVPLSLREKAVYGTGIGIWLFYVLPELNGHTYVYEVFGGIVSAIVLALLVVPAIASPDQRRPVRHFMAGALIACLPFLAFTYGPAAAAFYFAALGRRSFMPVTAGAVFGVVVNALALVTQGSVPGYVAYHLYQNIFIYPAVVPSGVAISTWSGIPHRVVLCCLAGLAVLAIVAWRFVRARWPIWRGLLMIAGVLSLLARGPDAMPFFYAVVPLALLLSPEVARLASLVPPAAALAALAVSVLMLHLALWDRGRLKLLQVPTRTAFSEMVRAETGPVDRILVYPYNPLQYILADRLPGSAHHFFLPQQAVYNERPVLGVRSDPCRDIVANRPKFIFVSPTPVWGKVSFTSYAGCIADILDTDYRRARVKNAYVLK